MFLRSQKKSPGWGLIAFGLVLCLLSVILLSGIFGPVPEAGRASSVALFGVPLGIATIVVGIVTLLRSA